MIIRHEPHPSLAHLTPIEYLTATKKEPISKTKEDSIAIGIDIGATYVRACVKVDLGFNIIPNKLVCLFCSFLSTAFETRVVVKHNSWQCELPCGQDRLKIRSFATIQLNNANRIFMFNDDSCSASLTSTYSLCIGQLQDAMLCCVYRTT